MSRRRSLAATLGLLLALAPALAAARAKEPKAPSAAPAKDAQSADAAAREGKPDAASASGFGNFSFTSRKEPIEITSEKLDFDYRNRRTVFRGDVEVVQGDVHLTSDVLTVDYTQVGDEQQLKEVTADGHVRITQAGKQATGNHAVFNQATRTVVLTGNAVLEEGSNQVSGDRIVVHPDESKMEVLGENRRVKVVLFPGKGPLASGKGEPTASVIGAAPSPAPDSQAETSSDGPTESP